MSETLYDSNTFSLVPSGTGGGGSVPAWFSGAVVNQWTLVPLGNTRGQLAAAAIALGYSNAGGTFSSAGALTSQSRKSIVAGDIGGHTDGTGNEVVEVKLNVTTPVWSQLRYPSSAASVISNAPRGQYADGQPSAVHGWVSACNVDDHYVHPILDATVGLGNSVSVCYSLDMVAAAANGPTNAPWVFRGDKVALLGGPDYQQFSPCCYDPVTRKILVIATLDTGAPMYTITVPNPIVAGQWTHTNFPGLAGGPQTHQGGYGTWAQAFPSKRFALLMGGGTNGSPAVLWGINLDNLAAGFSQMTTSGMTASAALNGGYGVFHVAGNAMYLWPQTDSSGPGAGVYKCTLPVGNTFAAAQAHTFTFSTVAGGAVNPGSGHTWGSAGGGATVYSRFGIIQDMGAGQGCLTLLAQDGTIWIWKLP